jgi:large subunit ribosomal protein L32e
MADLLKIKNEKRASNPKFIRNAYHKKMRISEKKWRKPRGKDNKLGQRMQGKAIVHPGYGTPASLRGTDKKGKFVVEIRNIGDLKEVDAKKHTAVISKKLGFKAKEKIIAELLKMKVAIHNIKNPEEYVLKRKTAMDENKKQKEVKAKDKKEDVKKKESIEDKLSDEEKKKLEKKEIDRLLTKKF